MFQYIIVSSGGEEEDYIKCEQIGGKSPKQFTNFFLLLLSTTHISTHAKYYCYCWLHVRSAIALVRRVGNIAQENTIADIFSIGSAMASFGHGNSWPCVRTPQTKSTSHSLWYELSTFVLSWRYLTLCPFFVVASLDQETEWSWTYWNIWSLLFVKPQTWQQPVKRTEQAHLLCMCVSEWV